MKRKLLQLSFLFAAVFLLLINANVYALSTEDKHAVDIDSVWHKTYTDTCAGAGAPLAGGSVAATSGPASPGPVYLVGDSIGTQVTTGLGAGLSGNGWSFQGNAANSRTLSGGMAAVDQDQAYIQGASAVVIELGTNSGDFSADAVSQMVDKIRSFNPNAKIYWVDTAVSQRQDIVQSLDNVNSVIYAQAAVKNYQVISWNKAVFGDGADPANINPTAPDNGYIRLSDQYVHLTDAGVDAMVGLIAGTVTGSAGGDAGTGGSGAVCAGNASASCLVGGDNETKIWNYFAGKGLPPVLVAAIMGSLYQESGYNPLIMEGGRGESTDPNAAGSGGWGLAQWTPGGKVIGIAADLGITGPISELATQLEIIWGEMNTTTPTGYVNFLPEFQKITDLPAATSFFTKNFEGPEIVGPRLPNAEDILSRLGSTTPPGGTTTCV